MSDALEPATTIRSFVCSKISILVFIAEEAKVSITDPSVGSKRRTHVDDVSPPITNNLPAWSNCISRTLSNPVRTSTPDVPNALTAVP